jgi:hypothetical protein
MRLKIFGYRIIIVEFYRLLYPELFEPSGQDRF